MNGLATEDHKHVTVIVPYGRSLGVDLDELWAYRELLLLLVWRDATVRYKQSVVGIGWAVIQPLMMMAVFSMVFGRFAGLPSGGVPYPVFALCALLPWNYFARSLSDSSHSIVGGSQLVTKIYFPRLILPIGKVFAGLIDFAIAFIVLICALAWYRITPSRLGLVMLPFFMAMAVLASLAVGLWLTALNVKYRDVSFVVPFLVQLWMFASPVAYSSSIVPTYLRSIYALNPMAVVVDGFRWALLGNAAPPAGSMLVSLFMVLVVLVSGLFYFRRTERTFADII